uniref:Uncharacterized protein n=1 Tax=Arundo donax TaxID=35708 RepID=A0A0A9FS08_ARUDO
MASAAARRCSEAGPGGGSAGRSPAPSSRLRWSLRSARRRGRARRASPPPRGGGSWSGADRRRRRSSRDDARTESRAERCRDTWSPETWGWRRPLLAGWRWGSRRPLLAPARPPRRTWRRRRPRTAWEVRKWRRPCDGCDRTRSCAAR